MKKPIIGIISKHYNSHQSNRPDTFVRDEVKQAIFDNEGIAIGILPPNENIIFCNDDWKDELLSKEKDNLFSQIDLCDGIILQGYATTDSYEIIAAKYCYDKNIPCLGICAGQNNIVRALEGNTYKIPNSDKHNRPNDKYVHEIIIDKNSQFYNIIKKDKIMVNSRHQNTINDCPGLDKVAFCPDGYPDVVESKNKNFYLGVRFHPESLYKIDNDHNKIFEYFINCCKNKS